VFDATGYRLDSLLFVCEVAQDLTVPGVCVSGHVQVHRNEQINVVFLVVKKEHVLRDTCKQHRMSEDFESSEPLW